MVTRRVAVLAVLAGSAVGLGLGRAAPAADEVVEEKSANFVVRAPSAEVAAARIARAETVKSLLNMMSEVEA